MENTVENTATVDNNSQETQIDNGTQDTSVVDNGAAESPSTPSASGDRYAQIQDAIAKDVKYQLTPEDMEFLETYKPTEETQEDGVDGENDDSYEVNEDGEPVAQAGDDSTHAKEILDMVGAENMAEAKEKFKEIVITRHEEHTAKIQEKDAQISDLKGISIQVHNLAARMAKGDKTAIDEFNRLHGIETEGSVESDDIELPFNRDNLADPEVYDWAKNFAKQMKAEVKAVQKELIDFKKMGETTKVESAKNAAKEAATNQLVDVAEKHLGIKPTVVKDALAVYKATGNMPNVLKPLAELVHYCDTFNKENPGEKISLQTAFRLKNLANEQKSVADEKKNVGTKVKDLIKKKLTGTTTKNTLAGVKSITTNTGVREMHDSIRAKIAANPAYQMTSEELEFYVKNGA